MGKQINYYMGYNDFLPIAQAALDSGCIIYKRCWVDGKFKVISGTSLDMIEKDYYSYWFYLPEAGSLDIEEKDGDQDIDFFSMLNVISAGFSIVDEEKHIIRSGRLYVQTGLYTNSGNWIARSDALTKVYNKLCRIAKKAAPYIEIEHFVPNPYFVGKIKSKKYISPEYCKLVQNEDYILG